MGDPTVWSKQIESLACEVHSSLGSWEEREFSNSLEQKHNVKFSISKIPAKILSYLQPILLNNLEISVMYVLLWVWTISGYFPIDIINLLFFQHNFVSSFYYFFFLWFMTTAGDWAVGWDSLLHWTVLPIDLVPAVTLVKIIQFIQCYSQQEQQRNCFITGAQNNDNTTSYIQTQSTSYPPANT